MLTMAYQGGERIPLRLIPCNLTDSKRFCCLCALVVIRRPGGQWACGRFQVSLHERRESLLQVSSRDLVCGHRTWMLHGKHAGLTSSSVQPALEQ